MRADVCGWVLTAAVAFGPVGARAQDGAPVCTPGPVGGMIYGVGGSRTTVVPLTATVRVSSETKLADGNVIHGTARLREARSSAGKTMSDSAMSCRLKANGEVSLMKNVQVSDLPTKSFEFWMEGGDSLKIARVRHEHTEHNADSPTPAEMAEQRNEMRANLPPPSMRASVKSEQLGPQTIAGVEAQGTRQTMTVPAGAEGNDLPLVVVNEEWRSRKLGMVLKAMREDPRTGKSTYEVEELTMGEPDASLFAPPAGYRVVDPEAKVETAAAP